MVVVDNNVLSSLAKVERLDLLDQLFDDVLTTPSVLDELHQDEVAGYEFVARIDEVKQYRGGWLGVTPLSEEEIELADEIVDASLSFTDAECLAVAEHRDERLLTDDRHVGEVASQRGRTVWDLKLLLEACLVEGVIETESELERVIEDLRKEDYYSFSEDDRQQLFDRV